MRVQKLREEAVEKERDKHFNAIRPMITTKQEWWVKRREVPGAVSGIWADRI
jgi:hypothetical protein